MSTSALFLARRNPAKDRVSNKLADAVEDAIAAGFTPRELVIELSQCWEEALSAQKRWQMQEFNDLLAPKVSR